MISHNAHTHTQCAYINPQDIGHRRETTLSDGVRALRNKKCVGRTIG